MCGGASVRRLLTIMCAVGAVVALRAQNAPLALPKVAPTVDAILSLRRVSSPAISPDGRQVAYLVRDTDWDNDSYETQIWLVDAAGGAPRQLTNAKRSSLAPAWSPDGSKLAFISDRTEKRQIYLINPKGGEAEALTSLEDGVGAFEWSPDGTRLAYTAAEPKSAEMKAREKKYGDYHVVERDYRMNELFVVDLGTRATRTLTTDAFTVGSFAWSPDGTAIAFDHRINTDLSNSGTADISVVTVADGTVRSLVTQAGPDTNPVWSPDGTRVAFESAMGSASYYYTNREIAIVPASGGAPEPLTGAFDEDATIAAWKPAGIYFTATNHTWEYLYRVDPPTRAVTRFAPTSQWIGSAFSFARDGEAVAFQAADPLSMAEIYVAPVKALLNGPGIEPAAGAAKKLTEMNAQTVGWTSGIFEIVSWKSQDGARIEGVLHKPADFSPTRKYPLLVVIHGGPTGVSRPIPFSSAIYPIDIWVPRDVLVLEPNYRGSSGYGEKFRSLNVRNLGIGDAWDVLSGIDSLVARGSVDPAKVGAMGWSQGGYISAFLATHDSARFKAISVGAGISDWMTYYVNTDIHPFTRQYLKATPWDDPQIYARTSPITYIKQAKAPTLIQHGAADERVPLPDAYELFQGLQDMKVPTRLIVYKGFGGVGHGPSRPKSHRATMEHNLEWFDQYLFHPQARPTDGR